MGNEVLTIKECFEFSNTNLSVASAKDGFLLVTIETPLQDNEEIIIDLNGVKALSTFLTDYIEKAEELEK